MGLKSLPSGSAKFDQFSCSLKIKKKKKGECRRKKRVRQRKERKMRQMKIK